MKLKSSARLSFPLASAIAAMFAPQVAHAQQYWKTDGTGAVINTSNWSAAPGGPFTSAFTTNGNIVFGANSAITGATVDIGNITVGNNFTVTFTAGGTLGTGGTVRTLDVGTGSTLNLAGQAISTAAGTGFIKNGAGTLISSNSNAYAGGFTLNAGTVAVGGVNAMGSGGALIINGGTIRSNSTTSRDLTDKYAGGITIGGDFALGDVTNNGALTFTNSMALGANNRIITVNSGVTFGGIISGSSGVGFTKSGTGNLTLSNANSYSGATVISAGTLTLANANALQNSSGLTLGGASAATLTFGGDTTGVIIPGAITAANAGVNSTISFGRNTANGGLLTLSGGITSGAGNVIFTTPSAVGTNGGQSQIILLNSAGGYGGNTTITTDGSQFTNVIRAGVANALPATTVLTFTGVAGTGSGRTSTYDLNGFDQELAGLTNTAANLRQQRVTSATAATLTINNPLASTFGVTAGSGTALITGAISVVKKGAGTFTLLGNHTYTGQTTISAGSFKLGTSGTATDTPLGTTAAGTTVSGTGTLDLNGNTLGTAEGLSIAGSGTSNSGALANTGAAASYSGLVTLGAAARIVATGDIALTNASTITGATFGLTLDGASTNSSIASIIGTTSGTLSKAGSGTWILSGPNTYTGATEIGAGTLKLGASGTATDTPLGTTAAGTTVSGTGTLDLNGNTLGTAEGLSIAGSGTSNSGALANTGAAASYSGLVALGAAARIVATGDIALTNPGTITGATFGLTLDGASTNSSIASIIGTTSGTLSKAGSGTWILSGTNTYTGATTVNAGTLRAGATAGGQAFGIGSAVTTANTSGATLDLNGFSQIVGSLAGGGATGGNVTLGANATLTTGGNDTSTSYAGIISGSGTSGLTKTGVGTFTLGGSNTYTGVTAVSAGILQINNASPFGTTPGTNGSSQITIASGANLYLSADTTIAAPIVATSGSTISFGRTTTANGAFNLNGQISGGDIIFNTNTAAGSNGQAQTLNLGTAGSWTGTTTITAGHFQVGMSVRNASGLANVLPTGTVLNFVGSAGGGGGRLAAFDLNGQDQELAGLTNTGANLRQQRVTSATAATLTINNPLASTFGNISSTGSARITGAISLVKSGAGTFTLLGDQEYTGTTTISEGVLRLGSGSTTGRLTATTGITNNANLTINRSDAFSQATDLGAGVAITGTGSFTQAGTGTTTLTVANTYEGATNVNAGTLILSSTGSTHASSAVAVAAGTLISTPVATIGGSGTINGTLNLAGESASGFKNGGVLSPGAIAGDIKTLNAGTTTWNGGSIWNFDLSSSDNTSDKLIINGDLVKGTGVVGTDYAFNFMGSTPVWNTTYTLAEWSGSLTGFTLGTDFTFSNLGAGPYGTSSFAIVGNTLQFTAVPEPTSALAGLLLGAGLLRRKRNIAR